MTTTIGAPEHERTSTNTDRTGNRPSASRSTARSADASSDQPGAAHVLRNAWIRGDRALQYTVITVFAILLSGVLVVMSTGADPLPEPDQSRVLGERYIASLPATAQLPTLQKVQADYGTDGGAACTSKLEDVYESMLKPTRTASGKRGRTLDRPALANTRRVMSTYCPARVDELAAHRSSGSSAAKRP